MSGGAAQLTDVLRAEGGLLTAALSGDGEGPRDEPLLALVPDGPYALTLAAVREGYLLHYGEGNVVAAPDADLALLGGDRLYALALAELARVGDLDAVVALAELISDCARAHADGEPAQAAAAWDRAVDAIARRA
jgi:hypothetical protein